MSVLGPVEQLIQTGYNRLLREHVPKKLGVRNGVAVRGPYRLFDRQTCELDHKEGLMDAIRGRVETNDDVVVVGGGWGVSSVIAARQTDGQVTVYEGAAEMVKHCRETHRLNAATENVDIVHGIVGPPLDVWGDDSGAEMITTLSVSEVDVLIVDVEGAEGEILRNLADRPRVMIVEVHGQHQADGDAIESTLEERGYEFSRSGAVSPWDGHYVLTAVHEQAGGGADEVANVTDIG